MHLSLSRLSLCNPGFRFSRLAAVSVLVAAMLMPATGAAPTSAEGWLKQAEAQYQAGSVDKAITSAEKAAELKPNMLAAWMLVGNYQMEMGAFDKAVSAFDRANAVKPKDFTVLTALAGAMEDAGEKSRLIPVQKELFLLNPSASRRCPSSTRWE